MSLEKAIQKLTNAITAAKKTLPDFSPSVDPEGPIGLPPLKVTCKTELSGGRFVCVCRNPKFKPNCAFRVTEGPCEPAAYTTSVPFDTACQSM